MRYQLQDGNTIVATADFIAQHYPDAVLLPEPEPAPYVPPKPTSCTPAQGLIALFALKGIKEFDIQSAIDGIADPIEQYKAQVGYSRATAWERQSATMQALAGLLGLSEQDLDALFEYAQGVLV